MDTNKHDNQKLQSNHPLASNPILGQTLSPNSEPDEWESLNLTLHPKLREAVKRVVDWYRQGLGVLLLAGDCGCGKTHLAKVVFDKFGGPAFVLDWDATPVESVRNAVFYTEPDLFADIRQSYGGGKPGQSEGEIVRMCQRTRLLILDDLGVAHIREESLPWAQDLYWRILDARADKPTLITTNLKIDQIPGRIGKRAFSRLMGGLGSKAGYVDMFGIPDYRLRDWQRGLGQ